MTSGTTRDRLRAARRTRITGMTMLAAAVLVSCGSDDGSEALDDSTAATTAPTIASEPTAAPATDAVPESTTPSPESTAPLPESTNPPPESIAPAGADETPECLVGSWTIDSPAWVANASAASGESMRHVSGRYVYEFSDDGTYTVSVETFTIDIDGEEGPVRVESAGTEEGRWTNSVLTLDEVAILSGLDGADVEDLPYIYLESTAVNVSETGLFEGTRIEFGPVDQNQGIEGLGSVDCSSNTILVRAVAPIALDVPFSRL